MWTVAGLTIDMVGSVVGEVVSRSGGASTPAMHPAQRAPGTRCRWDPARTGTHGRESVAEALDGDVGEADGGGTLDVVGADADAHEDRTLHGKCVGGEGDHPAGFRQGGGGEDVAAALDANAFGVVLGGDDIGGGSAGGFAVLEGDVSIGMDSHVGVRRVGLESLAEDEHGLREGRGDVIGKLDVGADGGVTLEFHPGQVEGVGGAPQVGPTAGDLEDSGIGVEDGGAGEPDADVGLAGEEAVAAGLGWLGGCDDYRAKRKSRAYSSYQSGGLAGGLGACHNGATNINEGASG